MEALNSRLDDAAIRKLISHLDPAIRTAALQHFLDPPTRDTTFLDEYLDTVIKNGLGYDEILPYGLILLPMSAVSMRRLLDWSLNSGGQSGTAHKVCCIGSVHALAENLEWLASTGRLDEQILRIAHQRVELLDADVETVWQELIELCGRHCHEETWEAMPDDRAACLIEACARHKDAIAARVLEVLNQDFDIAGKERETPAQWLEPFCVTIAGQAGLTDASSRIAHKLLNSAENDDILQEAAVNALKLLHPTQLIESLAHAASRGVHGMNVAAVLGAIRTPESTQAMLKLLVHPLDPMDLTCLGGHALEHFDSRALLPARALLATARWDAAWDDLSALIEGLSDLFKTELPERGIYASMRERRAAQDSMERLSPRSQQSPEGYGTALERRTMLEMVAKDAARAADEIAAQILERPYDDFFEGMLNQFEGASAYSAPSYAPSDYAGTYESATRAELRGQKYQPPSEVAFSKAKAGPNDPCPCGSGRKFKKCCMGR